MTDKYVMMALVRRIAWEKRSEAERFRLGAAVHSNPRLIEQYERVALDLDREAHHLEDVLALIEQHGQETKEF